jgi:hypothetical protein
VKDILGDKDERQVCVKTNVRESLSESAVETENKIKNMRVTKHFDAFPCHCQQYKNNDC